MVRLHSMLRVAVGAGLLLALFGGGLAAQADATTRRDRSRDYFGCYELRLFEWSNSEGREAAESIPDRVWLSSTASARSDNGPGSTVVALDWVLASAPGFGPSAFEDERWSLTPAMDSIILVWSNPFSSVQAVLAMRGSPDDWRFTGRAAAWSGDARAVTAGQPPPVGPRGRAAGRSVDCER
jgi:hypothetical protein